MYPTALYGYLFTKAPEAAFTNYRLWESIGFLIALLYSDFICTNIKLYICICFLVVGMVCYSIVEVMDRLRQTPKGRELKIETHSKQL